MANICCTNFCITGEHDELQSAYNLLSSVEKNRKPGKSCWLGDIVNALGYDAEKYDCVGTFENVQFYGEVLSLDTDTAWVPMLDPFELLKKKFRHIEIFFKAEEEGCGVFIKNDAYGIHFPEDYYVKAYINGNYYDEYCITYNEMLKCVQDITGKEVKSIEEARDLEFPDVNDYLNVYTYKRTRQLWTPSFRPFTPRRRWPKR